MIGNDWDLILKDYFSDDNFKKFYSNIIELYKTKEIYPKLDEIFNAFKLSSYENTRVVIIGQDPYHGEGEAHGLAFSVKESIKNPPSLKNIFKELESDLGIKRKSSDLSDWAKQGVLLINTILTVEKDKPLSHKNIGWESFTSYVIQKLNEKDEPIVFVLWGNNALEYKKYITNSNHLIISSSHPSPFSANKGFFQSKPFSKINNFLNTNYNMNIKF